MKICKFLYLIISIILLFTELISSHSDVGKIDDLGVQIIKESKIINFLSHFEGDHLNSSTDKIYCNEARPCSNGGLCLQHLCVCLPGTSGPLCDTINDCDRNMCVIDHYTRCEYDVEKQKAQCVCLNDVYRFDIASRTCRYCACTSALDKNLKSFSNCEYQQGNKICTCTEGYVYNPKEETCDSCDCGENSKWCKFDEDGKKICTCQDSFKPYGYPQRCAPECKCGQHGKCNSHFSCDCDPGFGEFNNTCIECKCGKYGNCMFDTEGKQIGCSCQSGYQAKLGKCEMCYCGDNATCSFMGSRKLCGCANGFRDVNGFCEDKKECQKRNLCGPTFKCVNTMGSYKCDCAEGFEKKKNLAQVDTCADIDECANPNTCSMSDCDCLNTVGSYACVCKSGFVSRGGIGLDIFCEKTSNGSIYTIVAVMIFIVLLILLLFYIVIRRRSNANRDGLSGFRVQFINEET